MENYLCNVMINFHLKKIIFVAVWSCLSVSLYAQNVWQTDTMKVPDSAKNIWNQRISGDSLSSGFVIVIKKEVKAHKHVSHSEHICVLSGKAQMGLGDTVFELKEGMVVFIPQGTVHWVKVTSKVPLKVLSVQSPFFDGKDRVMVE